MSVTELLEQVKTLSADEKAAFARLFHELEADAEQKHRAFEETFGCMTPQEADEFQRVIDEGCERIDSP